MEHFELAKSFTGVTTWLGLAGAALLVFLWLFKTAATKHVLVSRIPKNQAARAYNLFMLLVALITLVVVVLAFIDGWNRRDEAAREMKLYQQAVLDRSNKITACIKEAESKFKFSDQFSISASVRCPGGGCLFDGNCNKRETTLRYAAPGSYYIESYALIRGSMNDGNVGAVNIPSRDPQNRATSISASLWCDPPDRPGANGGWANAEFQGTNKLSDEEAVRTRMKGECESLFPAPSPPV